MPSARFESELLEEHLARAMADEPVAHFDLRPIDKLTGGVHGGRVYFLTGGPGTGKTTLLVQLADELARKGVVVVFYSLELAAHRLVAKSLARLSGGSLSLADIASPASTSKINAAAEKYRESVADNLVFIDHPMSAVNLRRLIGEIKHDRNSAVALFVDYVQIMPNDTGIIEERLQIKAATNDLRSIANTYDCPVLAISSVARGNYDRIPALDKLGGSQSLEYSSDVVLCLAVEGDANDGAGNASIDARSIVAETIKCRYSGMGSTTLLFDTAHATFLER